MSDACPFSREELLELMGATMKRHDEIHKTFERLRIEAAEERKNSKAYKARQRAIRENKKRLQQIGSVNRKLAELYAEASRNKQTSHAETR